MAEPLLCPAAMVSVKSSTGAKSAGSASPSPPLPSTDTVIVRSDSKVLPPGTEAVTRAVWADDPSPALNCSPSAAASASTLRATAGGASSSSMVNTAPLTVKPEAVPDTDRSSSPSTRSSSAVVRLKV